MLSLLCDFKILIKMLTNIKVRTIILNILIPEAKIGLYRNLGGRFSVASVTILGQRD